MQIFIVFAWGRSMLDRSKRFEMIIEIVHEFLYLHHDSRLRIIHRDLKAMNILLNADMNFKPQTFAWLKYLMAMMLRIRLS